MWSEFQRFNSTKEIAFQIALAIRDEVLELEANHIRIIQIDEAALREKLPLRKSDWLPEYLDWAIPAFRLVDQSGLRIENTRGKRNLVEFAASGPGCRGSENGNCGPQPCMKKTEACASMPPSSHPLLRISR
jgi:hypothetical protein